MTTDRAGSQMICTGTVRGNRVELDDGLTLPEGTRVRVMAEETADAAPNPEMSLAEWLQAADEVRAQLPETSDSTPILRQLREERASR